MMANRMRSIAKSKNSTKICVYVGAYDGKVRKLKPSDGSVIWTSASFGDYALGIATDPDGYIYVGSEDGIVGKLDPSNGSTIWASGYL